MMPRYLACLQTGNTAAAFFGVWNCKVAPAVPTFRNSNWALRQDVPHFNKNYRFVMLNQYMKFLKHIQNMSQVGNKHTKFTV